MKHHVTWQTAAPLWKEVLRDRGDAARFEQPALLRFASDTFMEELAALLQTDPTALKDYVARAETWSRPDSGWLARTDPRRDDPLKLFQVTHGRFYLVGASLVCRIPGLPDHRVDKGREENASFVLRRLVPKNPLNFTPSNPATFDEWAWVVGALGGKWTPMPAGRAIADSAAGIEERLPMFPMNFVQDERPRRLWLGLVPVGSREAGRAAREISPTIVADDDLIGDYLADPRFVEFDTRVGDALQNLHKAVTATRVQIGESQAREVLLFVLLDFATFFQSHMPEVLEQTWTGSDADRGTLHDHLAAAEFSSTASWLEALNAALAEQEAILAGTLADSSSPANGMDLSAIKTAIENVWPPPLLPSGLPTMVKDALGEFTPTAENGAANGVSGPEPDAVPKLDPAGRTFYAIRCVYDQPQCPPIDRPVVSARASVPFQLAPFFDPDAPARPLRISMPVDTSPAGLRKFPRNVAVLISDQLRRQMNRVQEIKLQAIDDGNVGADEPGISLGMICSFSIPIITICALILLLIIVFLLNIVFWWLPFFRICLPLSLKAKEG